MINKKALILLQTDLNVTINALHDAATPLPDIKQRVGYSETNSEDVEERCVFARGNMFLV